MLVLTMPRPEPVALVGDLLERAELRAGALTYDLYGLRNLVEGD